MSPVRTPYHPRPARPSAPLDPALQSRLDALLQSTDIRATNQAATANAYDRPVQQLFLDLQNDHGAVLHVPAEPFRATILAVRSAVVRSLIQEILSCDDHNFLLETWSRLVEHRNNQPPPVFANFPLINRDVDRSTIATSNITIKYFKQFNPWSQKKRSLIVNSSSFYMLNPLKVLYQPF